MPRDTLYFDGQCGMCRRSVRILLALDWLGRLEAQDLTAVPESELPVPIDAAMRGIPMRTRTGGTLVGFPAIRRALVQTPLGALPGLVLYLPGISRLGRVAYDAIARRRRRCAVCEVSPSPGP